MTPPAPAPAPSTGEGRTQDKALQINLDTSFYGTFAEIGAGQEVADWFFRVGGAAGTVAKTMSAYDMVMSDAIYGKARRYVSRERLLHMLGHEWQIILDRLGPVRGDSTRFFVFANTIKARGFRDQGECHGWVGVRFQAEPQAPPSDILIHVRLLDESPAQQREAIGALGVNLMHAAFTKAFDLDQLAAMLWDGLSRGRIELDVLKVGGPAFPAADNRLCALLLVEKGMADAAMFTAEGEVVQPDECLYRKAICVLRGDFRPPTVVHLDMIQQARTRLEQHIHGGVAELMELSMHNLLVHGDAVDRSDFLARAQMLQALGKDVMVSNFAEFHRLSAYLHRQRAPAVGIVLGLPLLETLFDESWYADLEGGLLEGFGRLFKSGVTLFAYPASEGGSVRTLDDVRIAEPLRPVFDFLSSRALIQPIPCGVPEALPFTPTDVRAMILKGDPRWRALVPPGLDAKLMA